MENKKQKKTQEKYIELQILDQQIKQIQQQLRILSTQIAEIDNTINSLDDLKKIKPGTETLFPISSGIFIKGALKDNKEVNINVGGNVVVTKSIADAQKILENQMKEIKNLETDINKDLQNLGIKAMELEKEIIEISK